MAQFVFWLCLGLILAKWLVQLWLENLNAQNVRSHAGQIPTAFQGMMDSTTYTRSVEYTLAKSRFAMLEMTYDVILLAGLLGSGFLPWSYARFVEWAGTSVWAQGVYFFLVSIGLAFASMPLDWYSQFRLEERFGFNTTTLRLWCVDRLKGAILAFVIGYPLLILILKLIDWIGGLWWVWAWVCLVLFQVVMLVLTPVLILPLFNKLTPLAEGNLRDRLLQLGRKTGFHARNILVMDGSKRSRHSNAFFTGFGRFRKIVLFDTLIEQLEETELEAVLAHEIGHYKKHHVPKMLFGSLACLLAGLYLAAWLIRQPWYYQAFGFDSGSIIPALLVFALVAGTFAFWLTPLINFWSRLFEYQADVFARQTMGEPFSLIGALRKLNEKNLSNLTPHRFYSRFYYSHPTLLERERAIIG